MEIQKKNQMHQSSLLGIAMKFETIPGGYNPLHYHDELEIIYPLNGDMDIEINKKQQKLEKKTLTVIDSGLIHRTYSHDRCGMQVVIHISKKYLQSYLPEIEFYRITCGPSDLMGEKSEQYLKLCVLMKELTTLYMTDAPMFDLEADGIILQVMAILARDFSEIHTPQLTDVTPVNMDRIRQIVEYVQDHYRENVCLDDAANMLGIDKTYFCRFFKQHMGMSFLHYLNEVRMIHAYQDLLETSLSVAEVMEKNGLTNQKLFNRTFKEIYGCTPSEVRKSAGV